VKQRAKVREEEEGVVVIVNTGIRAVGLEAL
jgi:hypothetical protein